MKATQHCMSPLAQRFSAAGLLRFAAPSIGMMLVILFPQRFAARAEGRRLHG